jgi:DNA repair photolyase
MDAKPIRSPLIRSALADLGGRGARSNRESRYLRAHHETDAAHLEHERLAREGTVHEGGAAYAPGAAGVRPPDAPIGLGETQADPSDEDLPPLKTQVRHEHARSIISRNDSPDVPFDQSINPYRGCEHGCVYCFARPTHAYLGLSPGLDFETQLVAKDNAAEALERELRKPGYRPSSIALGANTDPYQPLERKLRITRSVLETLLAFGHPVSIVTKSALVLRDLDLLQPMARLGLARVWLSVGSLDRRIARTLEPRASTPLRRIEAIRALAAAGVPAGVITAPLIPGLTDSGMEAVLEAAAGAGASHAGYVALRLPLEVRDLFVEWLKEFAPLRERHVMSLVRQMHGGRDYEPRFGTRMSGTGVYAQLLARRFELACRRLGLARERAPLDTSRFRVPAASGAQQTLF